MHGRTNQLKLFQIELIFDSAFIVRFLISSGYVNVSE